MIELNDHSLGAPSATDRRHEKCQQETSATNANTATMAEVAIEERNYATIREHLDSPTGIYVSPLKAFLCSGENVKLKEEVQVLHNMKTQIGRVLTTTAIEGEVSLQWYVLLTELPILDNIPEIRPPPRRTYLKYPVEEVVLTNFVSSIAIDKIFSEVFIISPESIEDASFAQSVGMANAYLNRFQLKSGILPLQVEKMNDFLTFPQNVVECRTRHSWNLLSKVATTINTELCKTSLSQSFKCSKVLDISQSEWEYLENRLVDIEAGVEVIIRHGVSTL